MRFSAESTPCCGALHESAALEHLHFFKGKMFYVNAENTGPSPVHSGQAGGFCPAVLFFAFCETLNLIFFFVKNTTRRGASFLLLQGRGCRR
jgi:hypothetical protein